MMSRGLRDPAAASRPSCARGRCSRTYLSCCLPLAVCFRVRGPRARGDYHSESDSLNWSPARRRTRAGVPTASGTGRRR
eukprot:2975307-Rhodomonas_salina.1